MLRSVLLLQLVAPFVQILMHNVEDFQFCLRAKCVSHAPLGLVGKLNGTTPFPEVFWLKLLEKCFSKYYALVNVVTFHQGCAAGQPVAPSWKNSGHG